MRIDSMLYQPLVRLVFTRADVDMLMRLSAEHYDGTCQRLSQPGGTIYGMRNEIDSLDKAEIERVMQFREIDLLAKVTEQLYIPTDEVARHMHNVLCEALKRINAEHDRLNAKVG